MNLKIALIDNDYVVRAKTDLDSNGNDHSLSKFFQKVREELLPGQTAYLEIEDMQGDPVTFEISQFG